MAKWSEQLEFDLCEAIAGVLHKHGLHRFDKPDRAGWTPEMASEAMNLLQSQVEKFEGPEPDEAPPAPGR